MRGEHVYWLIASLRGRGSSPHARGTPLPLNDGVFPAGIIPACAGNTQSNQVCVGLDRDHPRMRGEHRDLIAVFKKVRGSSPHARGTQTLSIRT